MFASHTSSDGVPFSALRSTRNSASPPRWPVYRFGPFTISPLGRSLVRDGQPINIGSRAFDLLVVLLSAPGKVFNKGDILQNVWPSVFVEESNVKVQISHLRRVLGPYSNNIVCIPGRGYIFTGDVAIH